MPATITGTNAGELITGTAGADVIVAPTRKTWSMEHFDHGDDVLGVVGGGVVVGGGGSLTGTTVTVTVAVAVSAPSVTV